MRRAALGAGRRAAAAGRIHEPEHMLDAGLDETQTSSRSGRPTAPATHPRMPPPLSGPPRLRRRTRRVCRPGWDG
jgi:hypothetical protein